MDHWRRYDKFDITLLITSPNTHDTQVYLTFPRAFWLGDTSNPGKKPSAGFTQWLSPSYANDTNPKRWNQEAVDLAILPGSCAHPTLLYYIFGEQSATLMKEIAALPSLHAKRRHVVNFFKPYYSLLPNYKEESDDCSPECWEATDWVLDPLAGNGRLVKQIFTVVDVT
jgi:hypothetical protein